MAPQLCLLVGPSPAAAIPTAARPARSPPCLPQASPTASPSSTWWRRSAQSSTGTLCLLGLCPAVHAPALPGLALACMRLRCCCAAPAWPPCLAGQGCRMPLHHPLWRRERAAGLYSVTSFALAQQLVEIPYLIVQATVYVSMVYW